MRGLLEVSGELESDKLREFNEDESVGSSREWGLRGVQRTVGEDAVKIVESLSAVNCQLKFRLGFFTPPPGRYWAERAETRADVIVPRGAVGNRYGDIGFTRVEGGA